MRVRHQEFGESRVYKNSAEDEAADPDDRATKIQGTRFHHRTQVRKKCGLVPAEQLIEKLLENVVTHDARVGIGLAAAVKNCGRCLIDAVRLAEREVLVDGRVQRAALDESADLGHLRWGQDGGNRAIHVTALFPLFLIL